MPPSHVKESAGAKQGKVFGSALRSKEVLRRPRDKHPGPPRERASAGPRRSPDLFHTC